MNPHATAPKQSEDETVSVTIQTPGGLRVEAELDTLPQDIVRRIFEGHLTEAGSHLRQLTGLPIQITRKSTITFN